jgi:hypothetical protein
MTTKVITSAEQTILPFSQVKEWCRVTATNEATTLQLLIDAAIQQAEDVTWWSLRAKQIEATWINRPDEVKLPGAPIESIDKIEVYVSDEWEESDDAIEVVDMNDWIEVVTTYPLRITFTTGAYNSPMINMLMQDLIIAKWESRPEDSPAVDHILKRLAKHRNHVTS